MLPAGRIFLAIDRGGWRRYYLAMETLVSTQTMEGIDSRRQSDFDAPLVLMEQRFKGLDGFLAMR